MKVFGERCYSFDCNGWRIVILGTGSKKIKSHLKDFVAEYPNKVRVVFDFDSELARRIYAGAHMLILPSEYEPCGLTQMIAMRYGCIPIAHSIGGLRDTVADYIEKRSSTGFLYQKNKPRTLANCITRALEVFSDKKSWQRLQQRGMKVDFSWRRSAEEYLTLYKKMLDLDNGEVNQSS